MKFINAGGIIGVMVGGQIAQLLKPEYRENALKQFASEAIAIVVVMAVNALLLLWMSYCRKHGIK